MKIEVEERELIIKYKKKYNYEMYDKICEYTMGMNLNEIHIKYINNWYKKLTIFGDNFVKNNYNNCRILLNGKKYNLVKYFKIKSRDEKKNLLKLN